METQSLLDQLLGSDNTNRARAEAELNNQRSSNPAALMSLFVSNMQSVKPDVAQISCVLFKKYFLDNQEGVSGDDLEQMRQKVIESIDFKSQSLTLLKTKADLISKVYSVQGKNEELLGMLVGWAQSEDAISKQFAMHVFERQVECHLPIE